jgi:Uri superfamily endonuclease
MSPSGLKKPADPISFRDGLPSGSPSLFEHGNFQGYGMTELDHLPAKPGSYALVGKLYQAAALQVGRLGSFSFPPGIWVYFGSAWGPGGLRARIRHHASKQTNPHWHIDWLRPHLRMVDVLYAEGVRCECAWSQHLCTHRFASVPVPGFGASDCHSGCPAHLIHLDVDVSIRTLQTWLEHVSASPVIDFPFRQGK